MTGRPVIGVTTYVEQAAWTVWDAPAALVPQPYVEQVAAAGALPVLVPPVGGVPDLLDRLDGLVLVGGGDIDPARYGAAAHPRTGYVREARDRAEFALAAAALERELPLLGICRGMQVLNVLLGGTLHQHLPEMVGGDAHAPAPGRYGTVEVRVAADSRLGGALGRTAVSVSCYHHQAVDVLGAGLTAVAWARDGVVEGVELADRPFALGVQWHPEVGDDPALFEALVAASSAHAGRR